MIGTIIEIGASLFDNCLSVFFITKFNGATWRKNYYALPAVLLPFAFQLFADAYLPNYSILNTVCSAYRSSCRSCPMTNRFFVIN